MQNTNIHFLRWTPSAKRCSVVALLIVWISLLATTCGGSGSGGGGTPSNASQRHFYMGTTPFFATPAQFPDWRFENPEDSDLISIHLDDFWGVPWDQCNKAGCTPPQAWVNKLNTLAGLAKATNKPIYLALSPLKDRIRLAAKLDATGNKIDNWEPASAIDSTTGCYQFDTDNNAASYKDAYLSYVLYMVNLIKPDYLSPGIEINIPFTKCATQKTAWIKWYSDVHQAVKAAYPNLPVFATFQQEHMYGIADAQSACAGIAVADCFDQRLKEALTIPGDRLAYSTYPLIWKYSAAYNYAVPDDIYSRTQLQTSRKIWIAETGWAAVKVLTSYRHNNTGICGADLFPASIANDTEQKKYMDWLLAQAESHQFETVIWWLHRDYLDEAAAQTCPCSPATSDTCQMADIFYSAGAATGETLLRMFGNMALRHYNGTPRPAQSSWMNVLAKPHI